MADIVAKPISELRQEANTIHEANTRGENTQIRVGGLFQDIVDWLAVNVPDTFVTLMTPLAQINNAQLGAPSNGQGLVYNNGHWQYGDFGGDGGGGTNTVDWNNITNKPNTFIPSTSYALRKKAEGNIYYLQLTCTENEQTDVISSLEWPSGGGGGDLPSNVVLYTEDSWAEHFEDKECITTDVLCFHSYSGSSTHYLWLNTQNQLMYDDTLLGTGINWGNNVAPEGTQPKIEIEGNFYLSGDTGQMGIFHANKVGIANYNSDAEGFVGWRDLEVIDGDLYFAGSKISNSNLDLHLNGSHLYLWDTANESTIGSGVELNTGGGGSSSIYGLVADVEPTTGGTNYRIYIDGPDGQIGSEDVLLFIPDSGGGGGTDANAVHYITSGLSAGNVKLPTADKSGGLWASDYGIGDNNSVFGGISKVGNNISFQNNINGGIFKFNKPVLIENETLTLEYNGKKVEFSTPSRNDTSKRLDIKTYTYNSGEEVYVQDTGGYIYLNGSAISGGGGSTKLQVGSTIVSPDSNGIITIGYAGGTTVSTGTNSITISSTSGSGGVSKLKVGNTDVLPDSNGAITFAGSGVSASGSTITITGGGGGWTPSQGGSQITSDDIASNAVITAKINAKAVTGAKIDDQAVSRTKVDNTVITKTSLSNLCTKLSNAFNVIIAVQASSNGIDNKFWVAKEIQGSLSDSTFFFYKGTLSDTGRTCTNLIFEYQTNNNQIRPIKGSTYNEPLCFNTSTGPYEDQYAEITTSMVNTVCSVLSSSYSITVTAGSELTVSSTPDVTEFCQ